MMKERPILFSGAMVRAILSGRKTQTRRILKELPCQCDAFEPEEMCAVSPEGWQMPGHSGRWWCQCCTSDRDAKFCPYGKPGDRLWVKETFAPNSVGKIMAQMLKAKEQPAIYYRATHEGSVAWRWRPSIFMPREASRITLEIVAVRVERLQDITGQDAIAEGIHRFDVGECQYFHWRKEAPTEEHFNSAVMAYRDLWRSINGPDSWDVNPWVWVVEFKRV